MTETTETGAPATPETDIIAAGQAALKRISTQGKRLINEWVAVGKALSIGEAIEANKERGTWHKENFPDLAGPKFASTRSAAIWLASLPEAVVQQFHNDGKLNHPVAIRRAYEKAHKASVPAAGKAASKDKEPAGQVLADPATLNAMFGELVRMEQEKALTLLRGVEDNVLTMLFELAGDVTQERHREKRKAQTRAVPPLPKAA